MTTTRLRDLAVGQTFRVRDSEDPAGAWLYEVLENNGDRSLVIVRSSINFSFPPTYVWRGSLIVTPEERSA